MATSVLETIVVTPEDKPKDKNIATENSNIQNAESLVDKLQLLGMLPGPQKFYYQFFTANAGLVTSFGDLVDKINNGTATRSDYIDVAKDVGAVGASAVGLTTLVTGSVPVALPILIGVGIGLAALDILDSSGTLDYLDSKDYDLIAIKNDFLNKLEDITNNQQNKYEAWENLSPEKKAEWINSGGTPLDYDPTLDKLQELSKELQDKIKAITDTTTVLDPITVEAHPELVVEIVNGVASLKSGQTISHVALNTKYTTKELLQYNGLTEEQAKNLPVGFEVKVDSFKFTKYGYIEGVITNIAKSSVLDEKLGEIYPVLIELKTDRMKIDDKYIKLMPGMTCSVDIKIGKRRLIEYIISPMIRYKDEALREQ